MKKSLLCICAAVIFLSACKEENTTPATKTPTTPASSIESLISKNAPAVQKFTFNNETGTTITGKKGTKIKIEPNTYGSFSGQVSLSLKEVYTKKEMMGAGVFTGANGTQMLSSLGMFELKATRNGTEVTPQKEAEISMMITPTATKENTKVFRLVKYKDSSAGTTREEWVEYDKNWDPDSADQHRCKFKFNCLSWCNLDAYVSSGVNTTIKVVPPTGFGSSNMQVYFNLNDVNGLVMLYANPIDKNFSTRPLKEGLSGTVIMVALKDNKYYKKVLNVTFTNDVQLITVAKMDEATFAEMETLLGSF